MMRVSVQAAASISVCRSDESACVRWCADEGADDDDGDGGEGKWSVWCPARFARCLTLMCMCVCADDDDESADGGDSDEGEWNTDVCV